MSKQLPIYLIILLFITACANDKAQNNGNHDENSSGIPDHEPRPYKMEQLNQVGDPIFTVHYHYNNNGMVEKEVIRDSSSAGVRVREKEYIYEDTLVQQVIMHDGNGGVEYTVNYTYDEKDQLVRQESKDSVVFSSTDYKFDDKGNVKEEVQFEENSGEQKMVFTYERDSLLKSAHLYDASGSLQRGNVYSYNEKGQKTDTKFIDHNGDTTIHWTHTYDGEGRLLRDAEVGPNGQSSIVKSFVYDDDGNLLVEEQSKYQFYKKDFLYDENNRLHTEKYYGQNQALSRVIYYE